MVVDMELENAKKEVLHLMKEKDNIEKKLKELKVILQTNRVSMAELLVDSEGYPRADIDVYQVRHARRKIICLQNDFKNLMKKIEKGLTEVHSIAGKDSLRQPSPSRVTEVTHMEQDFDTNIDTDDISAMEPFLKVNLVTPGSPAELAGIRLNDLITEFGSINAQNFRALKDIGELVEQSRYKEVMVKVKRIDKTSAVLKLVPRPWAGKGLLGCKVNVIEIVER